MSEVYESATENRRSTGLSWFRQWLPAVANRAVERVIHPLRGIATLSCLQLLLLNAKFTRLDSCSRLSSLSDLNILLSGVVASLLKR